MPKVKKDIKIKPGSVVLDPTADISKQLETMLKLLESLNVKPSSSNLEDYIKKMKLPAFKDPSVFADSNVISKPEEYNYRLYEKIAEERFKKQYRGLSTGGNADVYLKVMNFIEKNSSLENQLRLNYMLSNIKITSDGKKRFDYSEKAFKQDLATFIPKEYEYKEGLGEYLLVNGLDGVQLLRDYSKQKRGSMVLNELKTLSVLGNMYIWSHDNPARDKKLVLTAEEKEIFNSAGDTSNRMVDFILAKEPNLRTQLTDEEGGQVLKNRAYSTVTESDFNIHNELEHGAHYTLNFRNPRYQGKVANFRVLPTELSVMKSAIIDYLSTNKQEDRPEILREMKKTFTNNPEFQGMLRTLEVTVPQNLGDVKFDNAMLSGARMDTPDLEGLAMGPAPSKSLWELATDFTVPLYAGSWLTRWVGEKNEKDEL